MANRQNTYVVIDTSSSSDRSYGDIVERVGGLEKAIATARKLGPDHAIAHCLSLLSSDEANLTVEASKYFYDLVETDMNGLPWRNRR